MSERELPQLTEGAKNLLQALHDGKIQISDIQGYQETLGKYQTEFGWVKQPYADVEQVLQVLASDER